MIGALLQNRLGTTPAEEALRAALLGVLFLGVLAAAELWKRRGAPHPEITRKLVHCLAGVPIALFPWLLGSPWTVLALGAAFAAVLTWSRRRGLLCSVHGVPRTSHGDLYYLAAVALLFLFGRDRPVLYLISILVLVTADTGAALLGSAYGRRTYAVETGQRSLEGSAAFFVMAFLSAHLPLLLLTDLERPATVLIAVQLALLVTAFEAISLHGNDNLIVPVATYWLLLKMTPHSAAWIGLQILLELAILGGLALLAWRTRLLSASGTMAAHLFFYGACALCGPAWMVAPALALGGVAALCERCKRLRLPGDRYYQVRAVFYVSLIATGLFLLDNLARMSGGAPDWLRAGHPLYLLFVGALAAQLAIFAFIELHPAARRSGLPDWAAALFAGLAACLFVGPLSLWAGPAGLRAATLAAVAAVGFGGAAFYCAACRLLPARREPVWELRLQAASVAAALLVVVCCRFAVTPW